MMRTVVFVVALLVRILAIELTGAQTVEFGDGRDYLDAAGSLCTAHVFPERSNLPFFRAPGLPFFIAGVTACDPSRIRAVKVGLAVADAVTVLLLFLIALQLHRSTRAAGIAAALATLNPFFFGAVTDIRGEPLFMMFLVAAIFFLFRRAPVLSGLCLGLATLVRPTGLLCIPLFAVGWLVLHAASSGVRPMVRQWRPALLLVLSAALAIAPWTIRNHVRFGEWILVNDAAGFNLWRGVNPELMRIVALRDPAAFQQASWKFESQTVSEVARRIDVDAKTPGQRDRAWRRLAIETMRGDPAYTAKITIQKALLYWRMWLHPAEHGRKAVAASGLLLSGMFVIGGLGLLLYPQRRVSLCVVAFILAMWLAHVPYIPTLRLRTPLTDPLLIVFAAGVLARVTAARPQSA